MALTRVKWMPSTAWQTLLMVHLVAACGLSQRAFDSFDLAPDVAQSFPNPVRKFFLNQLSISMCFCTSSMGSPLTSCGRSEIISCCDHTSSNDCGTWRIAEMEANSKCSGIPKSYVAVRSRPYSSTVSSCRIVVTHLLIHGWSELLHRYLSLCKATIASFSGSSLWYDSKKR